MASTTLANVHFSSQVFTDVMNGEFTHRLGFLNSGVMANAAFIDPNQTGYTAAIPKWDILSGDSLRITDSLTTAPANASTMGDVAVWVEREASWAADQMIRVAAGLDATEAIATQLGQYWAGELHRVGMKTLSGVFATALSSSHSTGSSYSGASITVEGGLAAKQKLGDNADQLSTFLCNSKVHTDAVKDKIVTYDIGSGAVSYSTGSVPMFLGARVNVTDKLEAVTSVYPSYFAANGAMIYKFRNRPTNRFTEGNFFRISADNLIVDVELYRNAAYAGGQDYLISRASFLTHVPGVKWNTTENPTVTNLGTGSNWTKVANDNKTIRIVELKTT